MAARSEAAAAAAGGSPGLLAAPGRERARAWLQQVAQGIVGEREAEGFGECRIHCNGTGKSSVGERLVLMIACLCRIG